MKLMALNIAFLTELVYLIILENQMVLQPVKVMI